HDALPIWLAHRFIVRVYGFNAGEMESGPEQHRGMAVREDEAIAIRPDRILRVKTHDAIPNRVDERRERHGRAGMSGLGLLHGIDRERANGVDAQLIELWGCQSVNWS